MSSKILDAQKLGLVFQSRPDILQGIKAAADSPTRVSLFNEIASFVYDQISGANSQEPALKRRRVDDGGSQTNGSHSGAAANGATINSAGDSAASEEVLLEVKDISLSIPQRKKFDLCFTKNYLYARAPNTVGPVQGVVYNWQDIEYAFYLPVPEKTQPQHNYILFPRGTCLLAANAPAKAAPDSNNATPAPGTAAATPPEPLVFTIPSMAPKPNTILGPLSGKAAAVSDSYSTLLDWALSARLRGAGNTDAEIVAADPRLFHSVVRQAHRPAEKAVHVKAFRGSKDGFLFFLRTGILWGFKKPLMFLPLDRIVAVSYTSVLQRTFNIVVEVDTTPPGVTGAAATTTEELEFAMLDQEDYAGIDTSFVKRHRLQDRSMAEQRRAKLELAENKKSGGGEGGEGGAGEGPDGDAMEDDGLTELERAARQAEHQAQDEEDEDEEDYDPGSDGDSEGEGTSSEEEEDDGDDDGDGEGGEEEEDEDDEEVGEDELAGLSGGEDEEEL